MKICAFIITPAQVYFWQHILEKLRSEGHEIRILARDYGETLAILNEKGMKYQIFVPFRERKISKIIGVPFDIIKAGKFLHSWKPDILLGFGFYEECLAPLLGAKAISFKDNEPNINLLYNIQWKLVKPFVSEIVSPADFGYDLGPHHTKVNCLKEMAYIHPKYFKPNDSIYEILGLEKDEPYIFLRFNAFDSIHDVGHHGFSEEERILLFDKLSQTHKVMLTSEIDTLPERMKNALITIPKSRLHDVLYYADLVVSDAHTVHAEAALMGTYSIRSNSYVGENDLSVFHLLEKHDLMMNCSSFTEVQSTLESISTNPNKYFDLSSQLNVLYAKMEDIVSIMVDIINKYDVKESNIISKDEDKS